MKIYDDFQVPLSSDVGGNVECVMKKEAPTDDHSTLLYQHMNQELHGEVVSQLDILYAVGVFRFRLQPVFTYDRQVLWCKLIISGVYDLV